MHKCTILRMVFEFIFIWYINYYICLQCKPGIGLSLCFSPFGPRCSIFYYPYLLFNSNFKFQLLSISSWLDGWWGKNLKISTQKCSLFFSIILVCPLVKICFRFPFLSVKSILFNQIIIYIYILWNYILLVTYL